MSERRKMKVKGKMLPVMTLNIRRIYFPPEPRKVNFPDAPAGLTVPELKKWMGETSGKVEAAIAAERARWMKERVPDTHIRIEFMSWVWVGRLLGEVGEKHVESIDGGELDEACRLRLPDGRVIHGGTEDLPNDRICANGAILHEERESGVSQSRPGTEADKIIEAVEKAMPKAVRHGINLARNDANKGANKVGAQRKDTPQRIRDALKKVDALLDAGKANNAAQACREIHAEMGLLIKSDRLQNIYSSPKERAKVGYKKAQKTGKLSRKK